MTGKIMKGIGGFYYVYVEGSGLYECRARGIFRNKKMKPNVGDVVDIDILSEEEKTGNLIKIYKRKNQLIRPMAANVDQALVIFAVHEPEPNFHLLNRFLITMEQQEIPVIICFNKTDLATTEQMQQLEKDYENSGCQVITVREELDIIKSYMTIINIRYNNEISIEYKVDENLLDILMLKLILQPLVENAVHHGMRQKEGKGELCISVQALDDKLMEVSVGDNGVGIPEDKIRLILEGGYKTSKSGFGLHSVKQRVELFYGIEDAVSISSQPGCWTEVRVRFSYKTDG